MHELVHDEGGTCHVPTILKERNEEVEDDDLREEDDYAPDPSDDTIDDEIAQRTFTHYSTDPFTEGIYPGINQVHRVLPEGEGKEEHQPHQ